MLNHPDSPYYEETRNQALAAIKTYPDNMQIGGGVNADNAKGYIEAGASHVIVTSYVFKDAAQAAGRAVDVSADDFEG